jgi:hypothetical protein
MRGLILIPLQRVVGVLEFLPLLHLNPTVVLAVEGVIND